MQVCVRLFFFFFTLPVLDRGEEKGQVVAGTLYEISFFSKFSTVSSCIQTVC